MAAMLLVLLAVLGMVGFAPAALPAQAGAFEQESMPRDAAEPEPSKDAAKGAGGLEVKAPGTTRRAGHRIHRTPTVLAVQVSAQSWGSAPVSRGITLRVPRFVPIRC